MKYGDVPDCISEWKNIGLNYKKGIYNIKLNCRQLHKAQIGEVVAVHINQSDFDNITLPSIYEIALS